MSRKQVFPIKLSPLPPDPLVSILITNYNYARYVGAAIESALRQTYGRIEVVVCDDGSQDGSLAVISPYAERDGRVILLQKENGGQASALNAAFARSKGSIVCILDADDLFEPHKVERVVSAFALHPPCGMVIHAVQVIDGDGNPLKVMNYKEEGHLGPEIPTLRLAPLLPPASGLSFRREVLEQIMPLPEERFRSVADGALANVAAYLTHTRVAPGVLAQYRIHGANLSGTTASSSKLDAASVEKILRGMERVIGFADEYVHTRFGIRVDAEAIRPILEHRIMLGILRGDRRLARRAAAQMVLAYRKYRRDYPLSRLLWWQAAAYMPPAVAHPLLKLAFWAFQRMDRRRFA